MQGEHISHRQLTILRDTPMALTVHKEVSNSLFLEFSAGLNHAFLLSSVLVHFPVSVVGGTKLSVEKGKEKI